MSDDIHDDDYLPRVLVNVLDQHHDPYCIKGLDSRYIYANLSLAKLIGVRTPNDFLHKTEFEFNSRLTENEDVVKEWQYQDKLVSDSKNTLSTLEVHPDAVDYPYIVRKIPFYDKNNQCVGIVTYGKTLQTFTPNDFVNGRCPGSLLLNRPDGFFTEKECEIIFLKLQGRTCKAIGDILFLSPRTIESALQRLYTKVGVSHFDDFAEFCHNKNYHRYLPRRFLECKRAMFENNYDLGEW
ncbi:PAS domain-containing protein [Candidatus Symbiopectobacterium sp. NZEC127]|uniref:PAS and helix-turn-helix domain-containing protein n=1 Tax=Candidatus Symbiopectobacterium sp. NZEC127 TaxID=2820472 RepID=UPI0022262402|nr:PAS and helix-turn-helix domain-containing protein [Candidatus Symbiopectobacterium sp. NZEC127]MCW2488610.1 PAS domain-containing protein [Candidatus Symbiopectobacterium sp. NZEC127]